MLKKIKKNYDVLPIQIKATVWFMLCAFVQKAISVLTVPIFTRIMNTTEYGQYNLFLSWQAILCVVITLNLPWGVFEQGLIKFEDKDNFVFQLQTLLSVLLLIWFLVYCFFCKSWNSFFSLDTYEIFALFSFTWTSSIFCFWSVRQRVDYKYKKLVCLTLVTAIGKTILGFILIAFLSNAAKARIMANVLVEIIAYVPLALSIYKKGRGCIDLALWRYAIAFNGMLIPHYLAQALLIGVDKIMIEKYLDKSAAGIYGLAYSISQLTLIFNSVILQVLGPWILRQIKENIYKNCKEILSLAIIIVGGLNYLLILLMPELLVFFAPKDYSGAKWVMPPLTISVYFIFLYGIFSFFELYEEKTKYISISTMMSALINIGLNTLIIPRYGYIGAGYTTLVCYIFYAFSHYLVIKYKCSFVNINDAFDKKLMLSVSLLFSVLSLSTVFIYDKDWARYLLIILILIVIIKNKNYLIDLIKKIEK